MRYFASLCIAVLAFCIMHTETYADKKGTAESIATIERIVRSMQERDPTVQSEIHITEKGRLPLRFKIETTADGYAFRVKFLGTVIPLEGAVRDEEHMIIECIDRNADGEVDQCFIHGGDGNIYSMDHVSKTDQQRTFEKVVVAVERATKKMEQIHRQQLERLQKKKGQDI